MPDNSKTNKIELTRRKILGSMGAVGAAGAGAGLGTSALFSDQEQFVNNRVVAGELDLKVDWEQTYNGEPVNAFPDEDGNDEQDEIKTRQQLADDAGLPIDSPSVETMFRDQFADLPDDWARPLIELDDVKPGDSGEITFSLHLFDNPGYIRMQGRCYENAENGINEPERNHSDEDGTNGPTGGELAEAIRAKLWYDDGDNVHDGDESVIFEGSLDDVQLLLCNGCPLDGNSASPFSSFNIAEGNTTGTHLMAASGGNDNREPFENSTTHHIGLSWELPRDVGNEVQSDSNRFDIGFFAQQARNNDGEDVPEQRPEECENWEWCKYEVKDVMNGGKNCPIEKTGANGNTQKICVVCTNKLFGNCELEEGKTDTLTIYETPDQNTELCKVEVESKRDECKDDCVGHHSVKEW